MKIKKMKAYLASRQNWWDRLPKDVQMETTRPGSTKVR